MKLTLLNNYILNIPLEIVLGTMIYVTALQILQKRWDWKKYFLYIIPLALAGSALGVFLFQSGLFHAPFYIGQIINTYKYILMVVASIYFMWERDWKTSVIAGGFAVLIQCSIDMFSTVFQPYVFDLNKGHDLFFYIVQDVLFYPFLGILVLLFLKKVRFADLLWYLMESRKKKRNLIIISLLYPVVNYTTIYLLEQYEDFFWNNFPFVSFLMLLVVLSVCGAVSVEGMRQAKLHEQEQLLNQQNLYISNLERMQSEMRAFRHDYKNMLSGLYLRAGEEDGGEKLQQLLSDMTDSFDEQIGGYIQQTTQLGNLRVTELRSLILGKMTKMQKRGIVCHLEILYPVEHVSVPCMELNRCLGILIDNAMEAVQGQDSPSVDILVSEQMQMTSFVVSNRVTEPVDFGNIWKEGYSTKGEGRGLGLYSFQKIVERYDKLLSSSSCRDGIFTQQLDVLR